MNKILYLAANGASEALMAQQINSNNLANASTTGFRADLAHAQSLSVDGAGFASRTYANSLPTQVDLAPGKIIKTDRELDVAIADHGFFAVLGPDGAEAYTRAGDFKISPEGILQTAAGDPVLGSGGPISLPPAGQILISRDGLVSIQPSGKNNTALIEVDRIKLVNPPANSLQKNAYGLLKPVDGQPLAADASVHVVQGSIEGSNVDTVASLVNVINLSRQFEWQVNVMKHAENNASQLAQLMRLS